MDFELVRIEDYLFGALLDLEVNCDGPLVAKSSTMLEVIEGNNIVRRLDSEIGIQASVSVSTVIRTDSRIGEDISIGSHDSTVTVELSSIEPDLSANRSISRL